MTIGDFRGNFGNFDENRPPQAVEIGVFANSCLQNEKIYETILSHEANCYILHNQQIAEPSSQKSRFLYRIILYDVGTALFLFLNRAAQAA